MDHSKHSRLSSAEFSEDVLMDATIYGPANEKIGSVSHVHGIRRLRPIDFRVAQGCAWAACVI